SADRLRPKGTSPWATVHRKHEALAAMNVTVRNVITSMRLLSALDWKEFFEDVSLVDEVLRTKSDFVDMDFQTRDRYRHAIEQLARRSGHPEIDVARRAIARTQTAGDDPTGRRRDPGYHLIAGGRAAFEAELGFRPGLRRRLLSAYMPAGPPPPAPGGRRPRRRPGAPPPPRPPPPPPRHSCSLPAAAPDRSSCSPSGCSRCSRPPISRSRSPIAAWSSASGPPRSRSWPCATASRPS